MAENKLADLSIDFAVNILKLTDGLKGHHSLSIQLLTNISTILQTLNCIIATSPTMLLTR